MTYCRWNVREGNGVRYWAFTPCKPGFNPLTKTDQLDRLKSAYEGRNCPICGKPIKLVGYVFDPDVVDVVDMEG